MSKKENNKQEPYHPLPYRKPNKIVKIYDEEFENDWGDKATITLCDYLDKKNTLKERHQLKVSWHENNFEVKGAELKAFDDAFMDIDDKKDHLYYDWYLSYHFTYNGDLYFAVIAPTDHNRWNRYFFFKLKDNKEIIIDDIDGDLLSYFLDDPYYEENTFYSITRRYMPPQIFRGRKARKTLELYIKHEHKNA